MTEGYASLDAHAFVDMSLNPAERAAFEAALRRDAKLRARVEAWDAQNEAIRLAFGGATRARHAPALGPGRPSNENNATPLPARGGEKKPIRAPRADPLAPPARATWRSAALGGLVLLVASASFAGGPPDPRPSLMRRADASLRAETAVADARLDFASDDPVAVAAWLGGRFAPVDAKKLRPPGWSLLGVRVVAGLDSAAALVLYEDALGGRAALMLTPTDALPDLPQMTTHDADETIVAAASQGIAYVAVGPTRSGVAALLPVASGD